MVLRPARGGAREQDPAPRARLAELARPAELARSAAKVAATDMPWTPALVALLRADDRTLAAAAELADAHELPHLAAAARASLGDPAGVAWFRDVGARDPAALARAFG